MGLHLYHVILVKGINWVRDPPPKDSFPQGGGGTTHDGDWKGDSKFSTNYTKIANFAKMVKSVTVFVHILGGRRGTGALTILVGGGVNGG